MTAEDAGPDWFRVMTAEEYEIQQYDLGYQDGEKGTELRFGDEDYRHGYETARRKVLAAERSER